MGPQRLELAERLVLDGLRHDEPLAGLPHPLQPDVVGLLVGVRVVDGPAGERRPTVRVVRAGRRPVAEQVSRRVEAPVGAVGAVVVPERLADSEAVVGLAVDHVSAGPHVRGDVEMHVREAEHRPIAAGALEGLATGADLCLREGLAAPRAHEGEPAGAPP